MHQTFKYIIGVLLFAACNNPQSSNSQSADISLADQIKNKTQFTTLTPPTLNQELKQEIYIPFRENGKFHIADYEGNRVGKTDFEEIKIFTFVPYFIGKLDGKYYLYSFPETKILEQGFEKPFDINSFKYGDAKGYPNTLIVDPKKEKEGILLEKPFEDDSMLNRKLRKQTEIEKMMAEGLLKNSSQIGNHLQVFEYKEEDIKIRVNDQLEVIYESKPVFIQLEDFDLTKIPEDIRPTLDQLKRTVAIQPYYVLNDGQHAHIFTCDGKYISSHKRAFNEYFSLNGPYRKKKFRHEYVPIGLFNDEQGPFYVRLSDGFEYRK